MRKLFKKLWSNDRGNALIIAGAALPMLVGAAGLATDTIQWALWKRQLQRAADSAALAGVHSIVQAEGARTRVGACGLPYIGCSMALCRLSLAIGRSSPGLATVEPTIAPSAPIQNSASGR